MRMLKPISISGAVLAAVLLLAAAAAEAQMRQASAEVVRATGRVEALRAGQTQWVAAAPGTRLVDGDHIRAMAGASADLALPDGSTILVAEDTPPAAPPAPATPARPPPPAPGGPPPGAADTARLPAPPPEGRGAGGGGPGAPPGGGGAQPGRVF